MMTTTHTRTADRHVSELVEIENEVIVSLKASRLVDPLAMPTESPFYHSCELMLVSPEGCVRASSLSDLEPLEKLYHALGLVIDTVKGA